MRDWFEHLPESSRLLSLNSEDLKSEEYLCIFLRKIYCIYGFLSEGLRMYYRVIGTKDVLNSILATGDSRWIRRGSWC